MGRIAAHFRKELRKHANPARAEKEKAYLKSPYRFFGASVPVTRNLAEAFRKSTPGMRRADVMGLAGRLWSSGYHEEKSLAVRVLEEYPQYLDMQALPMLEEMASGCAGWDHLDGIAAFLVGEVVRKHPEAMGIVSGWAGSENFWMRRAALICQIRLFRKGKGDSEVFYRMARGMLHEREFFIRKAIGWAVREISIARPQEALAFLMQVKGKASGLTLREGAKRLPPELRAQVLPGKGGG